MLASLEGNYKLTELGTIFQQAIQPYFAIAPASSVIARSPYDFTLNAYVLDNPALKALGSRPGEDRFCLFSKSFF